MTAFLTLCLAFLAAGVTLGANGHVRGVRGTVRNTAAVPRRWAGRRRRSIPADGHPGDGLAAERIERPAGAGRFGLPSKEVHRSVEGGRTSVHPLTPWRRPVSKRKRSPTSSSRTRTGTMSAASTSFRKRRSGSSGRSTRITPATPGTRRNTHGGIDEEDMLALVRINTQGRLRFVNGDDEEPIPGIRCYTGGKHTWASQYVGVQTAAGTAVFTSDNVYMYENMEKRAPIAQTLDAASESQGAGTDPDAGRRANADRAGPRSRGIRALPAGRRRRGAHSMKAGSPRSLKNSAGFQTFVVDQLEGARRDREVDVRRLRTLLWGRFLRHHRRRCVVSEG